MTHVCIGLQFFSFYRSSNSFSTSSSASGPHVWENIARFFANLARILSFLINFLITIIHVLNVGCVFSILHLKTYFLTSIVSITNTVSAKADNKNVSLVNSSRSRPSVTTVQLH